MTGAVELAGRVEGAAGADRELDFAILCVADPRAIKTGPLPGDPKYTASLDAAMSLAPAAYMLSGASEDENGRFAVALFPRDPDAMGLARTFEAHNGALARGTGATLPLAIVAAALRARASTPPVGR